MDWMRRQDVKEEPQEAPNALTPEDDDECYFEEDASIDEGMVREISSLSYFLERFGDRFALRKRNASLVLSEKSPEISTFHACRTCASNGTDFPAGSFVR